MHMTLVGVRDGLISAQVSESSPEPERRVLDSDTSAASTLQVFKHFRVIFITQFMARLPRYVYLGIGVIMGHAIKSARLQCSSL